MSTLGQRSLLDMMQGMAQAQVATVMKNPPGAVREEKSACAR